MRTALPSFAPELDVQLAVAEALLGLDLTLADGQHAIGSLPAIAPFPGIKPAAVEEHESIGWDGRRIGGRGAGIDHLRLRPADRHPPFTALVLAATELEAAIPQVPSDGQRPGLCLGDGEAIANPRTGMPSCSQIGIAKDLEPLGHLWQERCQPLR